MISVIRRFTNSLKLRHFELTVRYSSFVEDVRSKVKCGRDEMDRNLFQTADFFVLVRDKKEILVSKPEKKIDIEITTISYSELKMMGINVEDDAVLLSFKNGKPLCAVDIPDESAQCHKLSKNEERMFMPLRQTLFHLNNNFQMAMLTKCYALLDWKLRHQFCSFCGNILQNDLIRIHKTCSSCNKTHYPSVSPVGITLVSNENQDKVLLVRQPIHPPKMFTCIAGFIEPGESLEENIKREVAEEVGLEVCDIQYIGSQHWALTGNCLMMGCFATATSTDFCLDSTELEAAGWFDRMQVKDALKRVSNKKEKLLKNVDDIWIPPRGAIAYSLINKWVHMYKE